MSDYNDDWKATWDWADDLFLRAEGKKSCNSFFRSVAREVAERDGWGDCGSSDVWHASYHVVRRARESGVESAEQLMEYVCDWQGVSRELATL